MTTTPASFRDELHTSLAPSWEDASPPSQHSLVSLQKRTHKRSKAFTSRYGINQLTTAAAALFTLLPRLTLMTHSTDNASLRSLLIEELDAFTSQASNAHFTPHVIHIAKYLLCHFLDEVLTHNPSALTPWPKYTLMREYLEDQSNNSDEQTFTILSHIIVQPAQYIDLLEFYFICLSLGLKGKFRYEAQGENLLVTLSGHLYKVIQLHRGKFSQRITQQPFSDALPQQPMPAWRYILQTTALVCGGFILTFGLYLGFNALLDLTATPLSHTITQLANQSTLNIDGN